MSENESENSPRSKCNWYRVEACATITLDTYGREKQCEREFKKKVKVMTAVAKALGIDLWVDEILVTE
jgi:hypothetical protein